MFPFLILLLGGGPCCHLVSLLKRGTMLIRVQLSVLRKKPPLDHWFVVFGRQLAELLRSAQMPVFSGAWLWPALFSFLYLQVENYYPVGKKCLNLPNREKQPFCDMWAVHNPTTFQMRDSCLLTLYFKDSSGKNLSFWTKRPEKEFQSGTVGRKPGVSSFRGHLPWPGYVLGITGNAEIKETLFLSSSSFQPSGKDKHRDPVLCLELQLSAKSKVKSKYSSAWLGRAVAIENLRKCRLLAKRLSFVLKM